MKMNKTIRCHLCGKLGAKKENIYIKYIGIQKREFSICDKCKELQKKEN